MWQGIGDGLLRAFGLMVLAIPVGAAYSMAREATCAHGLSRRRLLRAIAILVAVAVFVAWDAGTERDCTESDSFRIACDVVGQVPVTTRERWSLGTVVVAVLGVAAWYGARQGLREGSRDSATQQQASELS
jgi:hypothetical protein